VAQRFDNSGGPYVEGSVSYIRVRKGRRVVLQRSREGAVSFERRLRAGLYRVASFQRPCDGTCFVLDPPTDRCSRRVRIFAGETATVRVVTRPGRGCSMRVREPGAFPPAAGIRAARAWVRGRAGSSFALIDSHGRLHGFAPRRRYVSASVVKAMLLVAYLRQVGNRPPSPAERAVLGPMIRWSDNDAADSIYARIGDSGLLDLARRARMRDLTVAGHWGGVYFSARDRPASSTPSTGCCHVARGRTRCTCSPRSCRPSAGASRASPGGPAGARSSRAAGAAPSSGRWCTRRRCSNATARGSRWRC
jgi:hypothetical protein